MRAARPAAIRPSGPAPGALLVLALALGAGCAGSGSTAAGPVARTPGVDLDSEADLLLDRGLEALHGGNIQAALMALEALAVLHPEHVPVGIWLQEARLARAQGRPGVEGDEAAVDRLRRAYRERAEREGGVVALVLAARLESDRVAALLLLERALDRDPEAAWAHYGRAHVLAHQGELEEAVRAIDAALAAEPDHLSAQRLEAWLLARSGRTEEAIERLEAWLARSGRDRLSRPEVRDAAELDLVLLLLQADRTAQALEWLGRLDTEALDPARRLCAAAVALEARGDHLGALGAVRRAGAEDPRDWLPPLQEALILERRLEDPGGALQAWRRVLVLTGEREDLGALLQRWRAQVHVERLERASGQAARDEQP